MLVGSSISAFNYKKSTKEIQDSDIDFALKKESPVYKSRDEINEDDPALQKFKDDLTTKGAVKFLYDFNMEKIEEMLEKYKEELLKEMEKNPELELDIDKMVSDYKKELLERFRELEDDKDKPKTLLSSSRIAFEIADKLKPKLEDILKL